MAFTTMHDYQQNFELVHSGLAQALTEHNEVLAKSWNDEQIDKCFTETTLGSTAFWEKKWKSILGAVERPRPDDGNTDLRV